MTLREIFRRTGVALLVGALAAPALALDLDYQVHGFAAQAVVYSDGNNALGTSLDGSVDFFEAGVNLTASFSPRLLASGQLLWRQEGDSDAPGVRLDYALLDYRVFGDNADFAGLRVGRVKNSFALFNDTRDVIFARPSIILPQSVYFDRQGFRSVLFASDGAQLYGGLTLGAHNLSMALTSGKDRKLSQDEKRQFGAGATAGDIHFRDLHVVRFEDSWDDEQLRVALSYFHVAIETTATPGGPITGDFDAGIYVLSLRYNTERYALTSEYAVTAFKGRSSGRDFDNKSDGAYVQADWLWLPHWTVFGRVDSTFSNRKDRDGREAAATTGRDRHTQFAHDFTAGLKWLPDEHWGVWGEAHHVEGSSTVSRSDNAGRTIEPRWNLFLLMAAYRF